MAAIFEGLCKGKATNVEIGLDKNGRARVRWDMIVVEGDHKGKRAQYGGKLDAESIRYTKRDMMLIGWQGKDVRTFVADVAAANRVVQFTAEIASNTYADSGKTSTWTSVRFESGQKPLAELDKTTTAKFNQWFAETDSEAKDDDDLPEGLR